VSAAVSVEEWQTRGLRGHQLAGEHELEIVWAFDDIAEIEYVRVAWSYENTRARRPNCVAGTLVGWATLDPNARRPHGGQFLRRYFWLADHDRAFDPDGIYQWGAPSEAVDPLTVAPRVGGALTARGWFGTAAVLDLEATRP
jgi:hypothetical protein